MIFVVLCPSVFVGYIKCGFDLDSNSIPFDRHTDSWPSLCVSWRAFVFATGTWPSFAQSISLPLLSSVPLYLLFPFLQLEDTLVQVMSSQILFFICIMDVANHFLNKNTT